MSTRSRRFRLFLLACFCWCAVGCALEPKSGQESYQSLAFVKLPKGVLVNTAGGNLLLSRIDLSLDTYLGPWAIGSTYNSASNNWIFTFETFYFNDTFIDPTGASHDLEGVGYNQQVPGTHWVRMDGSRMKTLGGMVFEYCNAHLEKVYWSGSQLPRIETVLGDVSGSLRIVEIRQCLEHGCDPIYTIHYSGNRISSVNDRTGRSATYSYDSEGRLERAKDALAVARGWAGTQYTYGDKWMRVQNNEGEAYTARFDGEGRTTRVEYHGAQNPAYAFAYAKADDAGRYNTRYTDAAGNVTVFWYDGQRRVTRIDHPLNESDTYVWGSGLYAFELSSHTNPANVTTSWTRSGNSVTESYPGGWVAVDHPGFEANAADRDAPRARPTLEVRDGAGIVSRKQWNNSNGRLQWVENGAGERTTYGYTTSGAVNRETRPNGVVTAYSNFGLHGHASQAQVGSGNVSYSYDAVGNMTRSGVETAATGGVVRWGYDENRNRNWISLKDGSLSDHEVTIDYRSDGQIARINRPYGSNSVFGYDALGRLASRTERSDGVDRTTTYDINVMGRLTGQTRPNGMRAQFSWDARGRELTRSFSQNGVVQRSAAFHYDDGRLSRTSMSGASVTGGDDYHSYDASGRPSVITYAPNQQMEIHYDARSRVAGRTYRLDGQVIADLSLGYDGADRETAVRLGGTTLISRGYSRGRLDSETFGNGLTRSYEYDDEGKVENTRTDRQSNGERREFTWSHPAGALLPSTQWETTTWGPEAGQTLTRESNSMLPVERDADSGSRLLIYNTDGHAESFSWDALSNRGGTNFTYNGERNRLQSANVDSGTVQYSYDAAGFVTSRDGVSITHNAAGQPTALGLVGFTYDGLGRRFALGYAAFTRFWHYGGQVEMRLSGSTWTPTALDLGTVRIDLESGQHLYRHLDHRNNVKFVTNQAGNVATHYSYRAFGVHSVTGDASDFVRFAQGYDLGAVSLVGARLYDSEAGRFLAPDPIHHQINQYAYTQGNPVGLWDPKGTYPEYTDITKPARKPPEGVENVTVTVSAQQAAREAARANALEAALAVQDLSDGLGTLDSINSLLGEPTDQGRLWGGVGAVAGVVAGYHIGGEEGAVHAATAVASGAASFAPVATGPGMFIGFVVQIPSIMYHKWRAMTFSPGASFGLPPVGF